MSGDHENKKINSYKGLVVWQKSMDLAIFVYSLTSNFPKNEIYGLSSQMRRCAVSVPSNIAEGSRRRGVKDKKYFLSIAFGSASELETQIELAKRIGYGSSKDYVEIGMALSEILKILNKMVYPTNY